MHQLSNIGLLIVFIKTENGFSSRHSSSPGHIVSVNSYLTTLLQSKGYLLGGYYVLMLLQVCPFILEMHARLQQHKPVTQVTHDSSVRQYALALFFAPDIITLLPAL